MRNIFSLFKAQDVVSSKTPNTFIKKLLLSFFFVLISTAQSGFAQCTLPNEFVGRSYSWMEYDWVYF